MCEQNPLIRIIINAVAAAYRKTLYQNIRLAKWSAANLFAGEFQAVSTYNSGMILLTLAEDLGPSMLT